MQIFALALFFALLLWLICRCWDCLGSIRAATFWVAIPLALICLWWVWQLSRTFGVITTFAFIAIWPFNFYGGWKDISFWTMVVWRDKLSKGGQS